MDVGDAGGSFDLLEGLVNLLGLLHLVVHLLAHEGAPQLLNLQLVAHLRLALVLAFVRGCLRYFLILLLPLDPASNRFFFIPDTPLDLREYDLRIVVLFLNIFHQFVNDYLGFNLLLFDTSAPLRFQFEDLFLVGQGLGSRRRLDLLRQEILLEATDDVQVLITRKLLLHSPVSAGFELLLQRIELVIEHRSRPLALVHLRLDLLNFLSHCMQLLLLLVGLLLDIIVFLLDVREGE